MISIVAAIGAGVSIYGAISGNLSSAEQKALDKKLKSTQDSINVLKQRQADAQRIQADIQKSVAIEERSTATNRLQSMRLAELNATSQKAQADAALGAQREQEANSRQEANIATQRKLQTDAALSVAQKERENAALDEANQRARATQAGYAVSAAINSKNNAGLNVNIAQNQSLAAQNKVLGSQSIFRQVGAQNQQKSIEDQAANALRDLEMSQLGLQQESSDLKFMRDTRDVIRKAQVARSSAINTGVNKGTSNSSATKGTAAAIVAAANEQRNNLFQDRALANRGFDLQRQALTTKDTSLDQISLLQTQIGAENLNQAGYDVGNAQLGATNANLGVTQVQNLYQNALLDVSNAQQGQTIANNQVGQATNNTSIAGFNVNSATAAQNIGQYGVNIANNNVQIQGYNTDIATQASNIAGRNVSIAGYDTANAQNNLDTANLKIDFATQDIAVAQANKQLAGYGASMTTLNNQISTAQAGADRGSDLFGAGMAVVNNATNTGNLITSGYNSASNLF